MNWWIDEDKGGSSGVQYYPFKKQMIFYDELVFFSKIMFHSVFLRIAFVIITFLRWCLKKVSKMGQNKFGSALHWGAKVVQAASCTNSPIHVYQLNLNQII